MLSGFLVIVWFENSKNFTAMVYNVFCIISIIREEALEKTR
jgi:hypothetical protein